MTRRKGLGFLFVSLSVASGWGAGCSSSEPTNDVDAGTDTDTDTDTDSDTDIWESCSAYDPCGDHGTCDDSSGVVQCDCDDGWGGEFCGMCAAGWHDVGGVCVLDESCLPFSCDGHGECDDYSGTVLCDCDTGYTGDYCVDCANNYHYDGPDCIVDETCADDSCSGYGTCDDSSGVVQCDCDDGWAGASCDTCAPGYHAVEVVGADAGVDGGVDGGSGEEICVLDQTCLFSSCDGHGTCDDTSGVVICDCDTGYVGTYCDGCDTGYHWADGICTPD